MLTQHEIEILQQLAKEYAEIAALPVHAQKRKLWLDNNEFRPARPMVNIDQVCWHEFAFDSYLTPQVEDPYWHRLELGLRKKIYSWRHWQTDEVFNPYISVPKPIRSSGWGVQKQQVILELEKNATANSQYFHNVLEDYEDIEKIQMPELTLDLQECEQRRQEAATVCDGIIPFRMEGRVQTICVWDAISEWRSPTACYLDVMDRPEFIHALVERCVQGVIHQIECINRLGLYDVTSGITHCSYNYLDDLPVGDNAPESGLTSQGWTFGMAQLFSSCSPQVTEEFEVAYMQRLIPYFGAVYYGCCERLDDRLDVLAKMDKVRKISCSPWSDRDHFAEAMPERCVMSVKPNPALLASPSFDEELIRKDLRSTMDAAKRYNRSLEFILKDISTVKHEPWRLQRWAEIAMEEVQR